MKVPKSIGNTVKQYVAARDRLRVWQKKKDEEETKRKTELLEMEMWLLVKADEMGVDSFKTPFGTAYKQIKEHYRIGNWDNFVAYVKETNNFQLFEKRVAKLAAKEIHNTTKEIPSGLDYSSEYVVHVLRPAKKSSGKED